jgi:hypothetical protein
MIVARRYAGTPDVTSPNRTVVQADTLAWLPANPAPEDASVVTSLPDVSELTLPLDAWKQWFVDAARLVIRWTPGAPPAPDAPQAGVAMFYQSDVRQNDAWIDKSYLILRAAEAEDASVLFHKIVCRKPPGTIALGRPSYSHLVAVTRGAPWKQRRPGPDVLPDAGDMQWSRAMGETACAVACAFLRDETKTRVVVDPFCGRGSVLAVANAMGFDAIGIDVSAKRCRAARRFTLERED